MEATAKKEGLVPKVMISIKVNAHQVVKGTNMGIAHKFMTRAMIEEKTAKTIAQVGKAKAMRLNRLDTAGNDQADGGNLLAAKEGIENVSPIRAYDDLRALGYHVSNLEIMEKENDNGFGFLRITFSTEQKSVPNAKQYIDSRQAEFVSTILDRTYRKVYGYLNPATDDEPENMTWNFGGPITDGKEIAEKKETFRFLRFGQPDSKYYSCPKAN